MTQRILPFQYEVEDKPSGMTAMGGLPLYLDMMQQMRLRDSIAENLKTREDSQGYTDVQMVTALMLLNLAGGDCVEDLRVLEGDDGFCRLLMKADDFSLNRKERRERCRRWRKESKRTVPSPSSVFRYLNGYHDVSQERQMGAWIPEPKDLNGFSRISKDMLGFLQKNRPVPTATLDMDATLIESDKQEALFCYKGFKGYQPLNMWWSEQDVVVHTEFRDGNVPASFELLRFLKESIENLPSVEKVYLRSDTAGYEHKLLKYCNSGKSRFGRIEFAISCDVTPSFRSSVMETTKWNMLYKEFEGKLYPSNQEWAEVCFIPNKAGFSKKDEPYRYIAIREVLYDQMPLPGLEEKDYPFPVMDMGKRYKVFGMVTNMVMEGGELIRWQRKRCGKSEEAHSIMKTDFAGGRMPSDRFGANAAWWWIMILSLNLNSILKSLVLDKSYKTKRMKAIRFSLINIPARIIEHARKLIVRLSNSFSSEIILRARETIAMLQPA